MYVGLPNFSKNYTAIYQTLRLVEEVTKAFNNRKATGVFLIDIKKAFNKVWHYGLVSEMVTGSFLFYLTAVVHSHLMVKNFTDKGYALGRVTLTLHTLFLKVTIFGVKALEYYSY
ncbi:uncharacterized protein LOC135145021 [Zophobas morio]|uniref:uncharacterized protein LOC135145021 n=1 Tax=Zophobas morio TaxID=2755281 RepID=UPI003083078F